MGGPKHGTAGNKQAPTRPLQRFALRPQTRASKTGVINASPHFSSGRSSTPTVPANTFCHFHTLEHEEIRNREGLQGTQCSQLCLLKQICTGQWDLTTCDGGGVPAPFFLHPLLDCLAFVSPTTDRTASSLSVYYKLFNCFLTQ